MSVMSIGFGPLKGPDTTNPTLVQSDAAAATGVASTYRLSTGALSTVAATLPGFAGRRAGDLHTIPTGTTSGTHYVAVGEDGKQFIDDFQRVNSTLIGRGWIQKSGSTWSIADGQARSQGVLSSMGQNFTTKDLEVASEINKGTGGTPGIWAYGTQTGQSTTGYFAQFNFDATTGTNITLRKDNVQVAAVATGSQFASIIDTTMTIYGSVIKVYVGGVEKLSYTDPGARPTGSWTGISTGVSSDTFFRDFQVTEVGTYVWVPVGGGNVGRQPILGTYGDFTGVVQGASGGVGDAFEVGNDLFLTDINVSNTAGLQGAQDRTQANLRFGLNGPTLSRLSDGAFTLNSSSLTLGALSATTGDFSSAVTANGSITSYAGATAISAQNGDVTAGYSIRAGTYLQANSYASVGTTLTVGTTGEFGGSLFAKNTDYALEVRGGDNGNTDVKTQIALGYSGSNQYRHAIRTQHQANLKTQNQISFWLWDQGVDAIGAIGTHRAVTMDRTQFTTSANAVLNNMFVGDVGFGAGLAGFIHKDGPTPTANYALLQSASTQDTYVNTGNVLYFRRGNVDRMVLSSTGIRVASDVATPRALFDVFGTTSVGKGTEVLKLYAGADGDNVWLGLYARAAAPLQRTGYIGQAVVGGTEMQIANELVNGDINLTTLGTGLAKVNGNRIYRAGQGRANGVVEGDIAYDTIQGAAGPGVGSLGSQAVYGYNIKDQAVTYDKLSLGARAYIEVATVQLRDGFTRYVTSPTSGQQDTAGNSIGNLLTSAAVVADGLAYNGFALKATSGTTANNTVLMSGPFYGYNSDTTKSRTQFPNQGPGLTPGQYRCTIYARTTAITAINPLLTVNIRDSRGSSVVPNVNYSFTPAQFASTNYVGLSLLFTVAADTYTTVAGQGLEIEVRYNTLTAQDVWISHVVVEPASGLAPNEVTTTYLANASVTSAKIQNLQAGLLTAGTINSDDIFLGPSGKIYAGQSKLGARTELTSAGIAAYSSVNLLPAAASSFEDGTTGGWTVRNTATIANSSAFAWVGTKSLSVTGSSSLSGAQYSLTGLTIGGRYTFSAYVYTAATGLTLRLDTDNQALDSTANTVIAANTWTRLTLPFLASATTHSARIFFGATPAANSVFYIDGAQFEGGVTALPYTSNTNPIRTIFNLTNQGEFTLNSPGPDTGARMLLNTGGLEFYNAANQLTVDLMASDGTFVLQSGPGNANVARYSSTGLDLYTAGGVNTVKLANTGAFTLQSAASSTRMEITSAGIKGYNGTTLYTNLDSSTGKLTFFQGTAAGSRVEFDSTGLKGYNGASLRSFLSATDGSLQFFSPQNASGYRIELDANGLRLTNGTTTTVDLTTVTGNGTFTGTVQGSTVNTASSGTRVVLTKNSDAISLYNGTATYPTSVRSYSTGNAYTGWSIVTGEIVAAEAAVSGLTNGVRVEVHDRLFSVSGVSGSYPVTMTIDGSLQVPIVSATSGTGTSQFSNLQSNGTTYLAGNVTMANNLTIGGGGVNARIRLETNQTSTNFDAAALEIVDNTSGVPRIAFHKPGSFAPQIGAEAGSYIVTLNQAGNNRAPLRTAWVEAQSNSTFNGAQIGGSVTTGFYYDGNIALRASAGFIYFQDTSGANTYGVIGQNGWNVNGKDLISVSAVYCSNGVFDAGLGYDGSYGFRTTRLVGSGDGGFYANGNHMVGRTGTPFMYNAGGDTYYNTLGGTAIRLMRTDRAVYASVFGGAYSNASSRKLKRNIKTMERSSHGLKALAKARPVLYQLALDKQDAMGDKVRMGFIAEEMYEVFPEVVNTDSDGTMGIDYASLTAVLAASLQELAEEVATLKAAAGKK